MIDCGKTQIMRIFFFWSLWRNGLTLNDFVATEEATVKQWMAGRPHVGGCQWALACLLEVGDVHVTLLTRGNERLASQTDG